MSPFVNLIPVAEQCLGTARIGLHHCGHRTGVVLTGHLQQFLSHRTRAVLSSVWALCASACNCCALLQSYDCTAPVLWLQWCGLMWEVLEHCSATVIKFTNADISFPSRFCYEFVLTIASIYALTVSCAKSTQQSSIFFLYFFVNFSWVCLRAGKV